MSSAPIRPGTDIALVAAAAAWGVVLLVLATVLPVEIDESYNKPGVQPMYSLVHINGAQVLWLVAIPLVTAAGVGALLLLHRTHGWRVAPAVALATSIALTAAGMIGTVTFLIGAFVVPTGVLLIMACVTHRRLGDAAERARRPAGDR